jgi:hypothetical protein
MFVFFFVGFQWIIVLDVFLLYYVLKIDSNISSDLFLNLGLLMSHIVIFCRIMNHLWIINVIRLCYVVHI